MLALVLVFKFNYTVLYKKDILFLSFIIRSNDDRFAQNFLLDKAKEILIQTV